MFPALRPPRAAAHLAAALVLATAVGGLLVSQVGTAAAGTTVPGPAGPPVSQAAAAFLAYAPCEPGGVSPADSAIADQLRPQMNGRRMGQSVTGYNVSCAGSSPRRHAAAAWQNAPRSSR